MPVRDYWEDVHRAWKAEQPDRLWRMHSDAVDIAWLQAWLAPARVGRLLKTDLFNEGIAPGLYPALSCRAEQVVGIDVSLNTTRAARDRHPGLVALAADVRQLPFRDEAFDVVVSNSTLDHFERASDIETSLSETRRVLRHDGRLLISLDNPLNPMVALRNLLPMTLLHGLGLVPYYVGATYGPHRLARALRAQGFEVEAQGAVVHCPRWFAVVTCRLLERRLRSPAAREQWLRVLGLFEHLARLPTTYLSGHLVVARARKVQV